MTRPCGIDRQVRLVGDVLALPAAWHRNAGQWVAIGAQLLDASVPGIGDPDVALGIEAEADLFVELAGRAAGATEHALERAVESEHLDALVARVGDVDLAGGADGDRRAAPRRRPGQRRCALGVAQAPPLAEELAARVEVLDAMVPGVGDVDVAVRRHGDAPRLLELAVTLARAPPKLLATVPSGLKTRHARGLALDDVELAVGPDRDVLGIGQGRAAVGGLAVDGGAIGLRSAGPRRAAPVGAAAC